MRFVNTRQARGFGPRHALSLALLGPCLLLPLAASAAPDTYQTTVHAPRPSYCEKHTADCIASTGVPGGNNGSSPPANGGAAGGGGSPATRLLDALNDMSCDELSTQVGKWEDKIKEANQNIKDLQGLSQAVHHEQASIQAEASTTSAAVAADQSGLEQMRHQRTENCLDTEHPAAGARPLGAKPKCPLPNVAERQAQAHLTKDLDRSAQLASHFKALGTQAEGFDKAAGENRNAISTFTQIIARAKDVQKRRKCKP